MVLVVPSFIDTPNEVPGVPNKVKLLTVAGFEIGDKSISYDAILGNGKYCTAVLGTEILIWSPVTLELGYMYLKSN